ncbi:hypothetical protein BaRGS_00018083 [Batillaria attramentaria]|uniref:Uncharacterized protein n=1 Tax=Batillaria attramentaria TaxID=370345 RepID=A0ABD0KUA5_9CAEN
MDTKIYEQFSLAACLDPSSQDIDYKQYGGRCRPASVACLRLLAPTGGYSLLLSNSSSHMSLVRGKSAEASIMDPVFVSVIEGIVFSHWFSRAEVRVQ